MELWKNLLRGGKRTVKNCPYTGTECTKNLCMAWVKPILDEKGDVVAAGYCNLVRQG